MNSVFELSRRLAANRDFASRIMKLIQGDIDSYTLAQIPILSNVVKTEHAVQFSLLGHTFVLAIVISAESGETTIELCSFERIQNRLGEVTFQPLDLNYRFNKGYGIIYKDPNSVMDQSQIVEHFLGLLQDNFFDKRQVIFSGIDTLS